MQREGPRGCYCCVKATTQTSTMSSMDIDAALNELGMLSTVTESRRQFLHERSAMHGVTPTTPVRRQRDRQISEPSTVSATPSNSPQRGTYQILHINPQYVTSVTTIPGSLCYPDGEDQGSGGCLDNNRLNIATEPMMSFPVPSFGAKYSQDVLERDSHTSRLSRVKLARLKRFRRPYEVPWRQTPELCVQGYVNPGAQQDTHLAATVALATTPDRLTRGGSDHKLSNSNASTPEKPSAQRKLSMQRSRSLDELDFAKIQLAEAENHNIVLQKREIDNMSRHLRNLQVTE